MPPILSIVGKSKAGKTTLLERLLSELKGRGYRLATIKHIPQGFELDEPGKDSWRLAQAGSDAVLMSSPQKVALIKRTEHDLSLDELSRLIGVDFDLILTEGFRGEGAPKIEVHRGELGPDLLCSPQELLAVSTDESLDLALPQYSSDDVRGLADLIEERFLQPRGDDVVLFINGCPIDLNPFVKDFIIKTLLGMVSALKGVGDVRALDISIRRA